jgi:hypothetical protein
MVIVREHIILEKFSEESDPIKDMDIGLNHLISEWIKYVNSIYEKDSGQYNKIERYKINEDGSIDVGKPITKEDALDYLKTGSGLDYPDPLCIRGDIIKKIPDFIQFNNCFGDCYFNVSAIESLRGCPRIVYGVFCVNNDYNLTKLDFLPEVIYGSFYGYKCKGVFKKNEIRKRCVVHGSIYV